VPGGGAVHSIKSGREQLQQRKTLFDHPVGAGEQRVRHGEAERLCRLEVDHQLKLDGAWTGRSLGFSPFRIRSTNDVARRNSSTR
jgi:hypothetical protein